MVRIKIIPDKYEKELSQIKKISSEMINDCMQCGKCTAGCPASSGMDIFPHQIIRHLQLGQFDKVIESKTIWSCASCFTCAARCPRGVDLARLMEAIRLIILRQKGNNRLKVKDIGHLMTDEKMPQQAIVSAFRKYSK
jgi:heterodisulfide reductase subunit C